MKKLILIAAALMITAATYGQGSFLFNTRNTTTGNNVTFQLGGVGATGSDLFVEVLAGVDANNLKSLAPLLPLNRTGAGAGYTSPFGQIYEVPGVAAGTSVVVGYRAYQGSSFDAAVNKSSLQFSTSPVTLTAPPATPNEVPLGTLSITIVPEPATWALGLIGLGSLLAIRRRK